MPMIFFLFCSTVSQSLFHDAEPVLPRYRLIPGRELTWQSDNTLKSGKGQVKNEQHDKTVWKASVIRTNPDGSARLLIQAASSYSTLSEGKHIPESSRTRVAYADVFPDGRSEPNTTTDSWDPAATILPRLPKDVAEARDGWETFSDEVKLSARMVKLNQFEASSSGKADGPALVNFNYKKTYSFDPAKGLMTLAEHRSTTSAVAGGEGTGRTVLIDDKVLAPEDFARLCDHADRFIAAELKYDAATGPVWKLSPAQAKAVVDQAGRDLELAAKAISQPELKKALQERMAKHQAISKIFVAQAENWSRLVDKPVYPLEARDLQGQSEKLTELRGKVIVMDFWYRGCGWCLKAMPQVKQLAADFADQPVVILGVSIDPTDQDALVVTKGMNLPYPTVRIDPNLLDRFGVQGMPAVLIIDKAGLVRDMHLGYSPNLRESVGKIVKELAK